MLAPDVCLPDRGVTNGSNPPSTSIVVVLVTGVTLDIAFLVSYKNYVRAVGSVSSDL
jgi:hypothetical protein